MARLASTPTLNPLSSSPTANPLVTANIALSPGSAVSSYSAAAVAANGDLMLVCRQYPYSYGAALKMCCLGRMALTVGDGNGVYTVAGLEVTVAAQTDLVIRATATAKYIAILDTGNRQIVAVARLASNIALSEGNAANIGGFTITGAS